MHRHWAERPAGDAQRLRVLLRVYVRVYAPRSAPHKSKAGRCALARRRQKRGDGLGDEAVGLASFMGHLVGEMHHLRGTPPRHHHPRTTMAIVVEHRDPAYPAWCPLEPDPALTDRPKPRPFSQDRGADERWGQLLTTLKRVEGLGAVRAHGVGILAGSGARYDAAFLWGRSG